MLTNHKIDVYIRYRGDDDGLARSGTVAEKQLLSDADWSLINSYLHDINLENKNLLSEVYLKKHEASMLANCESREIVARLKQLFAYKYDFWEKKGLFERFMNWTSSSQD